MAASEVFEVLMNWAAISFIVALIILVVTLLTVYLAVEVLILLGLASVIIMFTVNFSYIYLYSYVYLVLVCGRMKIYFEGPKRKNQRIDEKLKAGSNPMGSQRPLKYSVTRSDVIKSIQKLLFESDADNGRIGVIVGPSGSGKTRAVIEACSVAPGPNYILYQEIHQASEAGKQLAHAADILPLSYTTFDYIYRFAGFDPLYDLSSDPVVAVADVVNKVAERSMEIIEKDNLKHLPCFVIDASELLAVHQPAMLIVLVYLAGCYIDDKKLRIVLVDSDGITLSKINESYPLVDIVEVDDLVDHDAQQYLTKQTKMSDNLAERVVKLIGGRLLHLGFAVNAYQRMESGISEDMMYERIKKHLFIKVVAPVNKVITNTHGAAYIIKYFCSNNSKPVLPSELKKYLNKYIDHSEVQKETRVAQQDHRGKDDKFSNL